MGKRGNVSKMSKVPPSKVTIVEVAEKAGVSLGTVSRVLNNDVHVAPEVPGSGIRCGARDGLCRQSPSPKPERQPHQHHWNAGPRSGDRLHRRDHAWGGHRTGFAPTGPDAFSPLTAVAVKEANYVANMAQGMADGLLLVLPRNPADFIGTSLSAISLLCSLIIKAPALHVPRSALRIGRAPSTPPNI